METVLQLYWLWIGIGIALMLAQIYLGTSFVIWVGGGATLFALLPIPLPEFSDPLQILIWAGFLVLFLLTWFTLIKPFTTNKKEPEISKDILIGEIGTVVQVPSEANKGMARFPYPLQGSDEWLIIPLDELDEGDQVTVVDLIGKSLVVKKN